MKKEIIKFRCSIYEKKRLKIRARNAGLSLSQFCRDAAFDIDIIERLTQEQIECYKTLVKYQNNFSSISNLFRNRDPQFSVEAKKLAELIKKHLNNFGT